MPKIINGPIRTAVFNWLDNRPFANSKELRNEFDMVNKKILGEYFYLWHKFHKNDDIKKKLIFLFHLFTRKMIPKAQITLDEKEILFSIEGLVMKLEKELGFGRGQKDVMDLLVQRGVLIPLPPEPKIPKKLMV